LDHEGYKLPDSLPLVPWKERKCLEWDFPCPDSLAPSNLNKTVTSSLAAANEAEECKLQQSSALYFVQVAVKTFGPHVNDATSLFPCLGKRIGSASIEFLIQRPTVAV
jgi:hypothetical protein